jgi:hypothetical protein
MLGKMMVGDLKCSIIGLKMRFILTCSLVCQVPLACEVLGKMMVGDLNGSVIGF